MNINKMKYDNKIILNIKGDKVFIVVLYKKVNLEKVKMIFFCKK